MTRPNLPSGNAMSWTTVHDRWRTIPRKCTRTPMRDGDADQAPYDLQVLITVSVGALGRGFGGSHFFRVKEGRPMPLTSTFAAQGRFSI